MTAHDPEIGSSPLFRSEAARKVRLEGEILLARPVRSSLVA